MGIARLRTALAIAASGSLMALLYPAPSLAQEGPIDLLSQFDIRVDGGSTNSTNGDELGTAVDGGQDVNADDIPDVVIGAPKADAGTDDESDEGEAYVIFGEPSGRIVDTTDLGSAGFRIFGGGTGDRLGDSVSMAGDVNNDDIGDVIIGSPESGGPGSAYVIFGSETPTDVDVGSLGDSGFRIDGQTSFDSLGQSVAGAGFINDDALADVVVGAWNAENNTRHSSGSAYVIFGKESNTTVSTAALGAGGFRIDGAAAGDHLGLWVDGARDVNDDERADVVIGTPDTDNNSRNGSGSAYVIFGKTSTTTIDTASLGTAGFRIDGAAASDRAGVAVGGARDVNNDGLNDVIVGAYDADHNSRTNSGSAYVVFGKTTTTSVDLAALGTGGFRIDGPPEDENNSFYEGVGYSVATARDMNADGFDDVIVGGPDASNNGRLSSGSAWVIFGTDDTTNIDLDALEPEDGFRIDGAFGDPVGIPEGDRAGHSVATAGDVNDDGLIDVILGAPQADFNDSDDTGSAYIELVSDWLPGACANPRTGTDGDDMLTGGAAGDDIAGGEGNDVLSGQGGDDCVEGENGNDTVNGGENADTLKGGDNSDTVNGGDGNDSAVNGGDGNDTLDGGDGNDEIGGGNGSDEAEGGTNKDTITGGDKGDTLAGEDGDDTLKGEAGSDVLKGGANGDTIKGGGGGDTIKGGDGGDTLEGGDNGDTLKGGDGKDTIKAGGGSDDIDADDGEKDTIKCGDGSDDVDADNKDVLIGC
jgi:Ca2+-binding RTX toxin-like protein